MNRRKFLKLGLVTGTLLTGSSLIAACGGRQSTDPAREASATPSQVVAGMAATISRPPSANFNPDIELALKATTADVQILAGKPTRVWTYQAQLRKGPPDALQTLPDSYFGPIIRARQGQKVRINFTNDLPSDQETVVHWHGLHLPENMDGHPRYAIAPGQSYVYEFEVNDWARTAWFHPHPHHKTASQIYNGLAGLFIINDDNEAKLGLPSGELDIPIIIQDRTFDKNNRLAYFGQGIMAGQMEQLMGFLGEKVWVNGRPDFLLNAKATAYRLRILNGSNGRIYKLGWSDKTPITVIGTDGGLLEKPTTKPYVMLAPGERVEVWADFSGRNVGDELMLNSLEFFGAEDPATEMKAMTGMSSTPSGAMNGMSGMDMSGAGKQASTALGAPMTLFKIKITHQAGESPKLPPALISMQRYSLENAANKDKPRVFELKQIGGRWKINGREFEMDGVADDEIVKLNATEVWEVVNVASPNEAMHKQGMAHPFHVHGSQFLVLNRELLLPELKPGYDSVYEGYLNDGWKDTFMLMPGERVKLLMKFSARAGTFVYHCHNLEHEDMGMMRNYRIVA